MNPDELDRMLARKSETACVEFFAGASEADRKAVAARALEWFQVSDAFRLKDSPMVKFAGRFGDTVPKQTQKVIDVIKEIESGKKAGVRSTPTFLVNGDIQDVSFGLQALRDRVERILEAATPDSNDSGRRGPRH